MEDSGEGFAYPRSSAQREPEEPMTLEGLPYEVGLRICSFLAATDLLHLALASSHTHALAADHSLWRERCLGAWRKPNLSPAIRTKIDLTSSTREINWKRFYFQKHVLEQRWTEQAYKVHKIAHEGTTVIQVLRTNRRIYEDKEEEEDEEDEAKACGEDEEKEKGDDEDHGDEETMALAKSENEEEVAIPTEEVVKRRGKRKSAKQDKKKLAEAPTAEDNADTGAGGDVTEGSRKRVGGDGGGATKEKKKKGGRKRKGGRSTDESEELVDWGWDFVTGDDDGQVILWSGQEFGTKKTVKAHDFIWWLEVHSDTCITASTDRTAKGCLSLLLLADIVAVIIDLNKMEVIRTLTGHPTALWCVDFSIEEDYVVSGGQHGDFVAWRLSDGEKLASHKFGSGLFDVRCVVTDLPIPRRQVQPFDDDGNDNGDGQQEGAQEVSESSNLSLSASRGDSTKMQRLAICTSVGDVDFFLYDIDTQQVIGTFSGHRATVTTVKRDGDLVLSGSDDKTIRVWDLATLKCLHTFSVGGIVYDIRLCENKLVAGVTGEQSSYLRVWDYVKRTHMMDIQVARVPRRIFSITVLPDRIYCCTNEHITVVDFRDVSGVEVAHKPKKHGRSRQKRDNCLLQ